MMKIFGFLVFLAFTGGAFAAAMTSGAQDSSAIDPLALPLAGSVPGAFTSAAPTAPAPGAGASAGTTPVCTSTTTASVCTYNTGACLRWTPVQRLSSTLYCSLYATPTVTCTAPVTTTSCT